MQLPREVNKRYSDFTPLNPGAMFVLVPRDVLSAFATYHVAFGGNIYADSHQEIIFGCNADKGQRCPKAPGLASSWRGYNFFYLSGQIIITTNVMAARLQHN